MNKTQKFLEDLNALLEKYDASFEAEGYDAEIDAILYDDKEVVISFGRYVDCPKINAILEAK